MKRTFGILALFLALACQTSKRMTSVVRPEPVADAKPVAVEEVAARHPGQTGVYLDVDLVLEQVTSSVLRSVDWSFFETTRRRYLVLDPEAKGLSTFSVSVPKHESLETVFLELTSPKGVTTVFERKDLVEEKGEDGVRIYKFAYPGVVRGSVIRESYVLKHENAYLTRPFDHDVPLQFGMPCEHISFKYLYPDWWEVAVKKVGPGRKLPLTATHDEANRKKILAYVADNLPEVVSEPYSPYLKEVSTYLELETTKAKMGDLTFRSHPDSWEDFGKSWQKYVLDKDPHLSGRVRDLARDLSTGKDGKELPPLAVLDAVVTWVQQNIETGSEQSEGNFADVVQHKQGTVYQKTALARSLLRKCGVPNDFMLIHSARDGYFDPEFISGNELYLPALRVPLENRTYVVFPFYRNLPIDVIPEALQGQPALALPAAGPAVLTEIPAGNVADNGSEETYDLTLQADGKILVKEERTLRGSDAYAARQALAEVKEEDLDRILRQMLTYTDGEVVITSRAFVDKDDYKKPLKVHLEYRIDNLLTLAGGEVLFNTAGLFSPLSSLKTKVVAKDRRNPIRIHFDEQAVKAITLHFPATWTLAHPPADRKVETCFGSLVQAFSPGTGTFQARQTLILKKAFEPKEKFPELLPLIGSTSRMSLPTLVFVDTAPR